MMTTNRLAAIALLAASALTPSAGAYGQQPQPARDVIATVRDRIVQIDALRPAAIADALARIDLAGAEAAAAPSIAPTRPDLPEGTVEALLLEGRAARIADPDFRGVIAVAPAGDGEVTLEKLDVETSMGTKALVLNRMGADLVYDGDIVVPPEAVVRPGVVGGFAAGRRGAFGRGTLWDDALLPFEVADDFCCRTALATAIASYETNTGFRFIPRDGHRNYIRFVNAEAFTSSRTQLGKQEGENAVRIQGWRSSGARLPNDDLADTITHEIGHELNLIHEHLRTDRDSFIARNPNCTRRSGFLEGIVDSWVDVTNVAFVDEEADLLTPYDFDSMMHYSFRLDPGGGAPICSTWVRLDTCTGGDPAAANCVGAFRSAGLTAADIVGLHDIYEGVTGIETPGVRSFTGDNVRYLGKRIDRCLHGLSPLRLLDRCNADSQTRVAEAFCRVHGFSRASNVSVVAIPGVHSGFHDTQGWRDVVGSEVLGSVRCDTPTASAAGVANGALVRREFRGPDVRIAGRDVDRCLWGTGVTGDRCSAGRQRIVANAYCRDRNFDRAETFATRFAPSPVLKGYHRDRDSFLDVSGVDVFSRITCLRTAE